MATGGTRTRKATAARFDAVVLLAVALIMSATISPPTANAGHMIGDGDCWRAGTPANCRVPYGGMNSFVYVRLVDQLNDSVLRGQMETARYNWTVYAGPQTFSWDVRPNDSIVYVRQSGQLAPNGYVVNYNSSGVSCGPCWIAYSVLGLATGNRDLSIGTAVAAHELGHTLGLYEHNADSNAVMQQGTSLTGPQPIDIGPLPVCSGITNSYMGVRCIYNWNY